jgi:thiol-disulfide isomerase/thioredoxin
MKQTFQILILIFSLLACKENQQKSEISQSGKFYPEVEQRSVIIGQIKNINEFSDAPRIIELAVDDITIDHQHSFETEIDDNGKFIFDIPLYHSINSYLNYGDARITPYLFPNDTIFLSCQIEKKGFKIGIVSGEFDEKHDKFENEFFKQYQWIHYDQINNFCDKLSKDLTPEELKTQYLSFENEILEKIENRVVKDSLNNTLADYLRYSARYSIYRDVIRLGEKIEDKEKKQEFYSFLTDSIAFNENAMVTGDYKSFLNEYRFNIEPRKNISVVSSGKTKEQVQMEFVTESLKNSFEVRSGVWAEYLAASSIYSFAFREEELTQASINNYVNLINENFKEPYVKQLLLAMCNKTREKVEKIASLTIPSEANLNQYGSLSGADLLDKIVEQNKGNVIYIDIWATWCSPCKEQIPHSQRMHEMLKGEKVSFVYLCCSSEEETWKKVITQYQMNGEHILLNEEQYEYIKTKFSISGIPRYILIDKTGEIINPDAPRPDSDEILNEIDRLIKNTITILKPEIIEQHIQNWQTIFHTGFLHQQKQFTSQPVRNMPAGKLAASN